ncbi:MAG: tRNA(Ile)(2)-agmatinylcytidine synthase [Methanothrix sp.]|nr:tRNA(Ile)(2)-agmatinylcytidine synthase [Methanothrix sp.]
MFIGIDDTDSERGLCTTYLAAVLMERLRPLGKIVGRPKLIRLNPCARYKTRGNAALAFELESDRQEEVREMALKTLLELSDFSGMNTNPGLVIAPQVTTRMTAFYRRAVTEILEIKDAKTLLDEEGVWYRGFKKGRGLIGALAAVGAALPDFTYELIAYRERSRWGTPRRIDAASVWRADALTYPRTWDTVDHHNNRIVFAPHSGDPVLFGIRGSDPQAILEAFQTIESESVERSVLYQTNQGTDAHILNGEVGNVKDSQSYRLRGVVAEPAQAIAGGHLFFPLQNGTARMSCAAFEPTKNFRSIVNQLTSGDELEVYGSVQEGTLNLEKINILHLADIVETQAPICPECQRRMESAGKGQGYRCRRCKTHAEGRVRWRLPRDLKTGYYEVPPCARRHLSKPLVRMNEEKVHPAR